MRFKLRRPSLVLPNLYFPANMSSVDAAEAFDYRGMQQRWQLNGSLRLPKQALECCMLNGMP